jgi:hypothetical protein
VLIQKGESLLKGPRSEVVKLLHGSLRRPSPFPASQRGEGEGGGILSNKI